MDVYAGIHLTSSALSIFCVTLALSLEHLYPISSAVNPLTLWRLVVGKMAEKVRPNKSTQLQHLISGSLALIVLIVPVMTIVYLIYEFAHYKWLIDIVLLYIALEFTHIVKIAKTVTKANLEEKKQLAKESLAVIVLRDTGPLSRVGVSKATIESVGLRMFYQQFVVVILFFSLGSVAALGYRLLYETHQVWNIKIERFKKFGLPVFCLTQAIAFIPIKLACFSLSLLAIATSNFKKVLSTWASKDMFLTGGFSVLCSIGLSLDRNLSGPVFRNGIKYKRKRFFGMGEVVEQDLSRLLTSLRINFILLFLFSAVIMWLLP